MRETGGRFFSRVVRWNLGSQVFASFHNVTLTVEIPRNVLRETCMEQLFMFASLLAFGAKGAPDTKSHFRLKGQFSDNGRARKENQS